MQKKYKLLIFSVVFDLVGMLSFVVPFISETFDILWAPVSAFLIYKMFKGAEGKVSSIISFVEEAGIFGTDFLPTFTLTWIYKFILKKDNNEIKPL